MCCLQPMGNMLKLAATLRVFNFIYLIINHIYLMLFVLNHRGIRQKLHKNYSLKVTFSYRFASEQKQRKKTRLIIPMLPCV